jgi:hypothetical protein
MKYSYVKSINVPRLESEIKASAIPVALSFITTSGFNTDIYFKAILAFEEEALLTSIVNAHINTPLPTAPKQTDTEGADLVRQKVTRAGWHYQYHAVEMSTGRQAKSFRIDPVTFQKVNTGFVTTKFYCLDINNNGSYVETADEEAALVTVVEWMPNHDMELRGGQMVQAVPPTQDVYFQAYNVLGMLHVPFTQGAINLKHFGQGSIIDADGQAAKPIPNGYGKFKLIFHHGAGVHTETNLMFLLYKAIGA